MVICRLSRCCCSTDRLRFGNLCYSVVSRLYTFFFQAEDGIRDRTVTGVQTCALPILGKDGSKAELHGGGILRFRPDGTQLEVYSSGTRNHLDVAINAEDEIFTYDNTDDEIGRASCRERV